MLRRPITLADVDLRDRLGLKDTPGDGERAGREAAGEDDDARTLWLDWDAHGERFKPWRDVCRESRTIDLGDSPLDGGATALHMAKAMERQGGDPRLWLERWIREKRLEPTDRVVHELRTLTDCFYFGGVMDQINLGGLIMVEALCRRIAVIVDAYAVPGRPVWENARHYTGVAAAEEVVAPSLRAHVLRRAKDEAEVFGARQRQLRGAPAHFGASAGADADGGGGGEQGEGAGEGRGRGRGRRGRGGRLPSAPP